MATNNYLAMGFNQALADALARNDARRMKFNENIDSTLDNLSDATKSAVGFYQRRQQMNDFGGDVNDKDLQFAKDYYIKTGDLSQLNTWKQNKMLADQAATSKTAAENEAKKLAQDAKKIEDDAIRDDEQPVRELYRDVLKWKEQKTENTPEGRAALRAYNDAVKYFNAKHPNALQYQFIELGELGNKDSVSAESADNSGYVGVDAIKKNVGDIVNMKDAELTADLIKGLRESVSANASTLGSEEYNGLNQKLNDAESRYSKYQAGVRYNAEVRKAAVELASKYENFNAQQKQNKVNAYLKSKDKKEQDVGRALKVLWGLK